MYHAGRRGARVELPNVEQAMFIENITLLAIFGNVWVKMNRFVMIVQEISGLRCIEAGGKCVKGPEDPGLLRI
ncbi:hypothetical protein NLA06_05080 [Desulfomicrobium sp. ZS1]|uniref:hypothetical protein n=1 Tax=Desulfomicrobium sp. ZS1 TaxID=2952228 RepID=UPI0020B43584|nr:hypothetical protein [Desulfomicrobium sp. ZS1]MDY0281453.1 hypothetical protein [Salinivirgaceae bacterium]UTF51266.1 hypothetical protein NLA06_05080 [Desulfomicrobium sp. ZS1]